MLPGGRSPLGEGKIWRRPRPKGRKIPVWPQAYALLVNRRGKCCNVRGREAGDPLDVFPGSIRSGTLVLRGIMK